MKSKAGLAIVFFVMVAGGLSFANRDENMEPADGFFLPQGDPAAGVKAFTDLKCNACHWVAKHADLNRPIAEKLGPLLGQKQADYSAGWIANSIVSPSHTISRNSDGQSEGSELSRMGDFTEVMTVRQLIDIVTYIKSLGEEKRPES